VRKETVVYLVRYCTSTLNRTEQNRTEPWPMNFLKSKDTKAAKNKINYLYLQYFPLRWAVLNKRQLQMAPYCTGNTIRCTTVELCHFIIQLMHTAHTAHTPHYAAIALTTSAQRLYQHW